jgi:hypothetical protein
MIPGLITSWSKTYCYFRTRLVGMDTIVDDEWTALNKRGALQGHAKPSASRYSMSRTCGPRDVISLVIPRVGDNKPNQQHPLAQTETRSTTTAPGSSRRYPPHQLASGRHWVLLHEVQAKYYGECHFNICGI